MRRLKVFLLPLMTFACIATLLGCGSPKGIAVNKRQTVVMDSSVLTAGIWLPNPPYQHLQVITWHVRL